MWRNLNEIEGPLPPQFVDAAALAPARHLDMQAALQPFVDNAISKTINIPEDYPFEDFKSLYRVAFDKGLKGCTTFRPNPVTGHILSTAAKDTEGSHCCTIEREAD